jgi:hypothetical protein
MPAAIAESMGSMSIGMGNFKGGYPQTVYILWTSVPGATISAADEPALISTSRPHPSLGKLAQAGFPLFRADQGIGGWYQWNLFIRSPMVMDP